MLTTTDIPILASVDECSRSIREIGNLQREIETIQTEMDAEAAKLVRPFLTKIQNRRKKLEALTASVQAFAAEQRGSLLSGNAKTVKLPDGELQFRKGRAKVLFFEEEDIIISRLRNAGHFNLIRITEKVDKQACAKQPDVVDAIVGIAIEEGDETVTIKPNAA